MPMETIEHHTEFVSGLDFNMHVPGQVSGILVGHYISISIDTYTLCEKH